MSGRVALLHQGKSKKTRSETVTRKPPATPSIFWLTRTQKRELKRLSEKKKRPAPEHDQKPLEIISTKRGEKGGKGWSTKALHRYQKFNVRRSNRKQYLFPIRNAARRMGGELETERGLLSSNRRIKKARSN